MADENGEKMNGHSAGAEKLGDFAHRISQLLIDRLAAHSARHDGKLNSRGIKAVVSEFTYDKDEILKGLCDSTWGQLNHSFEEAFYARMRKFPLERFIVARFVHLLPDRDKDPLPGRTLSRRIIPAFIQSLHQMVGPELFDEYEDRARELIEGFRAQEGEDLDWETLHERPVAQVLVNDILIYISRYFLDPPKRRAWMISFFERTMPVGKTEAEKAWSFGDMEFHMLISALYKELAEVLFDMEGRQRLEERYDGASLAELEQMLAAMAQDQRSVMSNFYAANT